MAGRETYLAYRKRIATAKLEFAEEAAKSAKEADNDKAEEKELAEEKDAEVKEDEGKKELAEEKEDSKDKEEDKEKEMSEFSKKFAEESKDLEGRLCKLEETMGDMLEMMSKKK